MRGSTEFPRSVTHLRRAGYSRSPPYPTRQLDAKHLCPSSSPSPNSLQLCVRHQPHQQLQATLCWVSSQSPPGCSHSSDLAPATTKVPAPHELVVGPRPPAPSHHSDHASCVHLHAAPAMRPLPGTAALCGVPGTPPSLSCPCHVGLTAASYVSPTLTCASPPPHPF